MRYNYPKVTGGYHWNMLQRCKNEVGIEPTGMHSTETETILHFSRELTPEEKNKLDDLMLDNPTFPPKSKSVLQIQDIAENFKDFQQKSKLEMLMYFNVSETGKVDIIELHFPEALTEEQKQLVKTVYANLISG